MKLRGLIHALLHPERLPVVRHLRYLWYRSQVWAAAQHWAQHGIGLGEPNRSGLEHLDKIWRGEA